MTDTSNPDGLRKRFPIQGFALGVPWDAAEQAYTTYSERYGKEQSLERLAERGGFGLYEFAFLYLGQYPRNNATASHREEIIGEALSAALATSTPGDAPEGPLWERLTDEDIESIATTASDAAAFVKTGTQQAYCEGFRVGLRDTLNREQEGHD